MSAAANRPESDCARHRRSPQREPRTQESVEQLGRVYRDLKDLNAGLQLGGIRATEARHARSARREHMKHGDPPD